MPPFRDLRPGTEGQEPSAMLHNERGFSLIEALAGATISVIAVIGLAYSFGVGRGLVDGYEVARAALATAESQMEALKLSPASDPTLALGFVSPPTPFLYEGVQRGELYWRVVAQPAGVAGVPPLRQVLLTVRWRTDARSDSVRLRRSWRP